jgi:hypothetical protein
MYVYLHIALPPPQYVKFYTYYILEKERVVNDAV